MIQISDYLQNGSEELGLSVLQTNGIPSSYVINLMSVNICVYVEMEIHDTYARFFIETRA